MSALIADYRTNKHIPSRKCYQLILEVSEEAFPEVCDILGYPRTGENTYVGIALLDKAILSKKETTEQSEGEKLRTRAVLICKDKLFCEFITEEMPQIRPNGTANEDDAAFFIRTTCHISSRSMLATNEQAQQSFRALMDRFNAWKLEQQYKDNLSR